MHPDLNNKQNVEETGNRQEPAPYRGQGRNQRIVLEKFQTVPGWTIYETNSVTGHRFYAHKKPNKGRVGEIRKVWFKNDRWYFQDPNKKVRK